MGGSERKHKATPSYEEGQLRDPSILEKMDEDFREEDLRRLVKRAVSKDTAPQKSPDS